MSKALTDFGEQSGTPFYSTSRFWTAKEFAFLSYAEDSPVLFYSFAASNWQRLSEVSSLIPDATWGNFGYSTVQQKWLLLPREANGNPTPYYLRIAVDDMTWRRDTIATSGTWVALMCGEDYDVAVANVTDATNNTVSHAIYYWDKTTSTWKSGGTRDGEVVCGVYSKATDRPVPVYALVLKNENSLVIEHTDDPTTTNAWGSVTVKTGVDTTNSQLIASDDKLVWYQTNAVAPYGIVDTLYVDDAGSWVFQDPPISASEYVSNVNVSMCMGFGGMGVAMGGKNSNGDFVHYIAVQNYDGSLIKDFSAQTDNYPVSVMNYYDAFVVGTAKINGSSLSSDIGVVYYSNYVDSDKIKTVTLTATSGGTVSASSTSVVSGTTITLSYKPDSNYVFMGWQVISPEGLVITDNKFTMPNSDVSIKGVFSIVVNKRIMNYQDIHSSNIDTWKSFREKYQSGDFAGAQAVAQTLTNTQLNAQALNDLFNFIVETEQLSDPTFKSDVIQVSATVPTGLQVGQMYFKEYN